MDAFGLVLADDDVPDGSSGQKVEDSIGVGSFGLFVATAFDTFVALHLSVEGLAGEDVHGLVENDRLFGDRKLNAREGEAWCWTSTKVTLCGVCTSLGTIALLVLAAAQCCCCGQCRDEGNDERGSELHCDDWALYQSLQVVKVRAVCS